MKEKKISIIIPCYGTEQYIGRCLDSLINQTYQNIEIIPVNDCSKKEMGEILSQYQNLDERIKVVTHKENRGLFQARLSGADIATGDYIAFLDSDDYVDVDFYRELIETAEDTLSDIVICNTVVEEANRKFIYNLFETGTKELKNENILNEYFKQKGFNYRWHTIWNKIYSIKLWKKAREHYSKIEGHLIMTEDFAFSTVLFYYAKHLTYNERANYFYCSNEDASTSLTKLTKEKCEKNITDIKKSFDFVREFLQNQKIYDTYKEYFDFWLSLYVKMWYDNIINTHFSEDEEKYLLDIIYNIDKNFLEMDFHDKDNFYQVTTDFNDRLIKLKEMIIDNDVISFDIFDTLIIRPFYEPKDMFELLNIEYNKLFKRNGIVEFSKLRIEAETFLRDKLYRDKGYEDITLVEIYDFISARNRLSRDKLDILMRKETELELHFCKRRETAFSLYKLARCLHKKVVATSDMYLPRATIEMILIKNGYENFERIYISCEEKISKSTGNLFKHLVVEQGINPNKILHIGDNINSDVNVPNSLNFNTYFFPKALDIFNNYCWKENNVTYCGRLYENFQLLNIDHSNTTEYMGNRIALAIVANKFFDNPFISYNNNSDFNCNPYMIGYYALGMHMLSLTNWLLTDLKEKKYDTICFMARDGYLPYLASQELSSMYDTNDLKLKYIYVSRKSLMPLLFNSYEEFSKIQEYIKLNKVNVQKVLECLKNIITLPQDYEEILENYDLNLKDMLDDKEKFYNFLDVLENQFYDREKYEEYVNTAKEYFNDAFKKKSATFDIGYSAKPELIISNLINKPIDTYFIHCNNDTAYKNKQYGNFKLNTFYDFTPTFTGTLREYLISSDLPSCIGYKKSDGKISIEYSNNHKCTYFNHQMLSELHNGCLDFLKMYKTLFKDYNNLIELNKYYMSLPYEYFLHYSKEVDRKIFFDLEFEENVSEKISMLDFWNNRIDNYNHIFNQYKTNQNTNLEYTYNSFLNERVRCRNKFIKLLFYMTYDRVALRYILKEKLNNDGLLYKSLRKIYKIFKK